MRARFPIAGSTASSSLAPIGRCASASSMKKWSSKPRSAKRSHWAPPRGGSRKSPTTACSLPAPGEPGKTPFWRGDQSGRPVELGLAIGRLIRDLRATPRNAAIDQLVRLHDLDQTAAENALRYLDDQAATGAIPDDRTLVIERCLDDLGDWRVCLLSPLGSRVHAPWAMAVTAHIRRHTGIDVEVMWGDEGFVVRFPEIERPPDPRCSCRKRRRSRGSCCASLARHRSSPLASARPRPGHCCSAPTTRDADAAVATAETGLRSHWQLPRVSDRFRAARDLSRGASRPLRHARARRPAASSVKRTFRVATIDSTTPSPFAASLLFSYVANYIYDGDAPLAERRAQALSVDQGQLRELLGDAQLRELLDPAALDTVERQLRARC